MKHVMLDLETWGKSRGCAIRSVGAVAFEEDGAVGETFYRNVVDWTCWAAGLRMEKDTAEWWARQNAAAKEVFKEDPRPIEEVVRDFHQFFRGVGAVHVWSQGAGFDVPIWEGVAEAVGNPTPWARSFWNIRDTRTKYHDAGFDPRSIIRKGTAHHALHDAQYQVECVQAAHALIVRKGAA